MLSSNDVTKQKEAMLRHLNKAADPVEQSQLDQLVKISDLCLEAKAIAESINDTFLAYMISMTVQAARMQMMPKVLRPKT